MTGVHDSPNLSITRRTLIKGGAVLTTGALTSGVLAGCAESTAPSASSSDTVRTPPATFVVAHGAWSSGWASGYWDVSENNRKARYYAITKAGQKQLARERQDWKSITTAVEKVLERA